jgi:LPXTG-motif cell wall-anchored protein
VSATVPAFTGPAPTGELPRTGSDAAVPAMAAVLVAGVALMFRRYIAALIA